MKHFDTHLLILTVGTGTESRRGNLAAGLVQTLNLVRPRRFWLIPSSSPDSTGIADLIRESAPPGVAFHPWTDESLYGTVENPDALEECRSVVRAVIRAARKELRKGEILVVNPTSGTKQMSAGATIAALDEGVARVDFTVGQREGGIVISGSEVIESFDASRFFADRALAEARALFAAGAHGAAARLLQDHLESGHPDIETAHAVARCACEWQRLRYSAARQIACHSESAVLAPLRRGLDRLRDGEPLACLADLLESARRCLVWAEPEEALARAYRAAELMAKIRLAAEHRLREPYSLRDFQNALPSRAAKFSALAQNGELHLGLVRLYETLDALGDRLGRDFFAGELQKLLGLRNETLFGHGSTSVSEEAVRPSLDALVHLAQTHLSLPVPERFPAALL